MSQGYSQKTIYFSENYFYLIKMLLRRRTNSFAKMMIIILFKDYPYIVLIFFEHLKLSISIKYINFALSHLPLKYVMTLRHSRE